VGRDELQGNKHRREALRAIRFWASWLVPPWVAAARSG
jgi:hypothetical protein